MTGDSPSSLSRRAFARAAAALAGGALAVPALARLPAAAAQASSAPAADSQAQEVEAKLARVLALYGSRLSPEQKQRMRSIIAGHVRMLQPIRAVAMTNADPPATVLGLVSHGHRAADGNARS